MPHTHVSAAVFVSAITKLLLEPLSGSLPVIAQPVETYCVPPMVSGLLTLLVSTVP